jgi:hypothetical protein
MVNSIGLNSESDSEYFQQNIAVKIVTPRLKALGHTMRVGVVEVNITETLAFVISEWGLPTRTRVVPNWKFQCCLSMCAAQQV